jgi:hypothetical protein
VKESAAELARTKIQLAKISIEADELRAQLREMTKLAELQSADLARNRKGDPRARSTQSS